MPEPITSFDEAFQRINFLREKRYESVSEAEGRFIHNLIKEHRLNVTLEIGLGYGASAVSIMSAYNGRHTCIDPYQQKNYQNSGLKNIEALGYYDRVDFYEDRSHNVLPRLYAERKVFDFIFIDGDHRFDSIFIDFYYADLLLSKNGYILFHDSWMRSTQLVASYIRRNRSNYAQIRGAGLNLILFQKSDKAPISSWDDFNEFYSLRGVMSHFIVRSILRFFNSR